MSTQNRYDCDYTLLPKHIREGFRLYIEEGEKPGGFISACLENKLVEAYGRADEVNQERMRDIVNFLYNEAPAPCWGSDEKVKNWIAGHKSGAVPTE